MIFICSKHSIAGLQVYKDKIFCCQLTIQKAMSWFSGQIHDAVELTDVSCNVKF